MMKPMMHKQKRKYHFAKPKEAALPVAKDVTVAKGNTVVVVRVVKVVIYRVNVVRPLCGLIFGKSHKMIYRMAAGMLMMAAGVYFAKTFGHVHNEIAAVAADGFGYSLHALGLVPFLDTVVEHFADD